VYSLVIQAAQDLGATVQPEDVHGNTPSLFVFRKSPGFIYSTERPYVHAVITFPQKPPLEAHVGIRVEGVSGVLHECDIAVLARAEAQTCRQNQVQPRKASLRLAVECKFYSVPLPLGLARGFVGLVADLPPKNARFLVFNTNSDTVERYLAYRDQKWEKDVYPGSPQPIQRLRGAFQTAFRDYIAVA
jgi:hypothetical protein